MMAIAGDGLATTYTLSLRFQRRMLPGADGGNKQDRQRMDVMANDTEHAPQHDNFISLEEDYQIDYGTREICGDA
jgi:hypothetical protein